MPSDVSPDWETHFAREKIGRDSKAKAARAALSGKQPELARSVPSRHHRRGAAKRRSGHAFLWQSAALSVWNGRECLLVDFR